MLRTSPFVRVFPLIVLTISLAAAFATGEELESPKVVVSSDAEVEDGNIEISSVPPEAEVRINGREEGRTPLTKDLAAGAYRITVSAEGYREHSKWISVRQDEEKRLQFTLSRITGSFDPKVSPAGATITVGEEKVEELPVQLPAGTYIIRISRFGYRPWEGRIRIRPREVTSPRVELEPAEAEITSLSASPARFNPRIGGPKGSSTVDFSVSAPAETMVRLLDDSGNLIEEHRVSALETAQHEVLLPSTEEGKQRLRSDARPPARTNRRGEEPGASEAGGDGALYTVRLTADFADGTSLTRETDLRVDPGMRPAYYSSPAGSYGTLVCPLPAPKHEGTQVAFTPLVFYDLDIEDYTNQLRFPTVLHLSRQTGNGYAFAGAVGVDIREKEDDAFFFGAEAQKNLLLGTLPRFLSLSASISGGFLRSHRRRSLHPRTGALLAFPLRLDAGPLGLVLSPKGGLLYAEGRDTAAGRYGAAGALLLEGGSATLALSLSIEQDSYRPNKPIFEVAAESRFIIPETDFAVSAYAGADLSNAPEKYSAGAGVGSTIYQ